MTITFIVTQFLLLLGFSPSKIGLYSHTPTPSLFDNHLYYKIWKKTNWKWALKWFLVIFCLDTAYKLCIDTSRPLSPSHVAFFTRKMHQNYSHFYIVTPSILGNKKCDYIEGALYQILYDKQYNNISISFMCTFVAFLILSVTQQWVRLRWVEWSLLEETPRIRIRYCFYHLIVCAQLCCRRITKRKSGNLPYLRALGKRRRDRDLRLLRRRHKWIRLQSANWDYLDWKE